MELGKEYSTEHLGKTQTAMLEALLDYGLKWRRKYIVIFKTFPSRPLRYNINILVRLSRSFHKPPAHSCRVCSQRPEAPHCPVTGLRFDSLIRKPLLLSSGMTKQRQIADLPLCLLATKEKWKFEDSSLSFTLFTLVERCVAARLSLLIPTSSYTNLR